MYKDLPLITNQIKPAERKGVLHHLLGCVDVREQPWTVQQFVTQALRTIDNVHQAGRLPVLVGGTHYYLQSLLFKNSLANDVVLEANDSPSSDPYTPQLGILDASTDKILAELKRIDPVIASRWHPNDRRKIRRSLEIYLQTGKKASELYDDQQNTRTALGKGKTIEGVSNDTESSLRFPTLLFWTHTQKEKLIPRLDDRVDAMISDGLLHEARMLEDIRLNLEREGVDIDESRGIWVTIGYKEFRQYLSKLQKSFSKDRRVAEEYNAAVERMKISTRQYSNSQIRWIRMKLVNALDNAENPRLFVLSTDDPTNWEDQVLRPAVKLTTDFLEGKDLPNPRLQSQLAEQMLTPRRNYDVSRRRDLWEQRVCECCGITAVTEDQWLQHTNGRRHRNTLRAQTKDKDAASNKARATEKSQIPSAPNKRV